MINLIDIRFTPVPRLCTATSCSHYPGAYRSNHRCRYVWVAYGGQCCFELAKQGTTVYLELYPLVLPAGTRRVQNGAQTRNFHRVEPLSACVRVLDGYIRTGISVAGSGIIFELAKQRSTVRSLTEVSVYLETTLVL